MPRRFLVVLLLGLLLGCVTTANYEAILQSWVGKPEIDLLHSWGPPSSVYESGGIKFLTYDKSSQAYIPGTAPSYQSTVVGNTVYTHSVGGSPGYAISQNCRTTFELSSGLVTSWRWDGNACKARSPD